MLQMVFDASVDRHSDTAVGSHCCGLRCPVVTQLDTVYVSCSSTRDVEVDVLWRWSYSILRAFVLFPELPPQHCALLTPPSERSKPSQGHPYRCLTHPGMIGLSPLVCLGRVPRHSLLRRYDNPISQTSTPGSLPDPPTGWGQRMSC
jgi:hypothetical protein